MRHILLALGLAVSAMVTFSGAAVAADPALGLWKTQPDDGAFAHVQMSECGSAICGVIARTFNADGEFKSPNLGKRIVIDMVPQGDGQYRGKVWRPSNNKVYIGKLDLNGNSMRLRGCVAGGLLCSKQTWVRLQ